MLEVMLSAARSAPTSSNLQAYSIVVVDDPERKARLAAIAGRQKFIEQAPLFLVFCADISRLRYVSARQGRTFGADTLEMFLLASVDAALAMQNTLVAAESLGLAVTPVGAVRDHPDQIAAELGLPEGVYALAGMSVGFEKPDSRRGTKPRLPQHVTVHRNQYTDETLEAGITEYDRVMIERKTYAGRHVAIPGEAPIPDEDYGWAEHTALRVSAPEAIGGPQTLGRRDLRRQLERRGFSFD
jgi:FMN reductase [NAD(P)H]